MVVPGRYNSVFNIPSSVSDKVSILTETFLLLLTEGYSLNEEYVAYMTKSVKLLWQGGGILLLFVTSPGGWTAVAKQLWNLFVNTSPCTLAIMTDNVFTP